MPNLNLTPWPQQIRLSEQRFVIQSPQLLWSPRAPAPLVQRLISRWRVRTGCALLPARSDQAIGEIQLHLATETKDWPSMNMDESYRLTVTPSHVKLHARTRFGLGCGIESLLQLVQQDHQGAFVPCVEINDHPRFSWRGLMLDVARHFMPKRDVLRVMDGMAALKLNVLHLHLSDDQGFRMESLSWPRLHEVGSNGEFFRHQDIREMVAHGNELGIRVIPELDMPGHCTSWLAAYPELAARPTNNESMPRNGFGISRDALDPTREHTYAFLQSLLAEVADLFPDACVHIGGDEVHPSAWQGIPHLDAFMTKHQIPDFHGLQAHFTRRVCDLLQALGKKPLAWDEVLSKENATDPRLIVQAWRADAARQRAVRSGNDHLYSSGFYLDLFYRSDQHYGFDPADAHQSNESVEDSLATQPGFARVEKALQGFHRWCRKEAATTTVPSRSPGDLLGGEACMWSEIVTPELLDIRVFSRLPAIAERFWSAASRREVDDFYRRLDVLLPYLEHQLGLRLTNWQSSWLAARGLSDQQISILSRLMAVLEPMKWYTRLLGDSLLSARALGEPDPPERPYTSTTPLNRLVDIVWPESLFARRLDRQILAYRQRPDHFTRHELAALAEQWMNLGPQMVQIAAQHPWCTELLPLSWQLAQLGEVMNALLHARKPTPLADSHSAAEMYIAVQPTIERWLKDPQ